MIEEVLLPFELTLFCALFSRLQVLTFRNISLQTI